MDVRLRDGNVNPLILPDWPAKYLPFADILRYFVDKPVAIANTFRRNQGALCVEPCQDVLKSLTFLADQALSRNLQIVKEKLVRFMIDHVEDGPHRHAASQGVVQVYKKDRKALGFFNDITKSSGPRQQYHQIGVLYSRNPHLLPVDYVVVSFSNRRRLDLRRIGSSCWLSNAHGLKAKFAASNLGQILTFLFF